MYARVSHTNLSSPAIKISDIAVSINAKKSHFSNQNYFDIECFCNQKYFDIQRSMPTLFSKDPLCKHFVEISHSELPFVSLFEAICPEQIISLIG